MIFPTAEQLSIFKRTPGAISVHEMIAIMNVTASVDDGTIAEMGSNQGKSGVAAACGLVNARKKEWKLHMVDPLYDLDNLEAWRHSCQGHPDNAGYGAHEKSFNSTVAQRILDASKYSVEPVLHGDYSINAIQDLHAKYGDFAYCFLDSDQHQYELVKSECELLRKRVAIGGIIAFHDFQSQFSGVEKAYREMVNGGMYSEIPIDWEQIKQWVKANGGEQGNQSWHHCDKESPCFFGALRRIK